MKTNSLIYLRLFITSFTKKNLLRNIKCIDCFQTFHRFYIIIIYVCDHLHIWNGSVFFVINSFYILAILFTNRLNFYGRRLRISGYNDICRKLVREVRFITFVPEFLNVFQIEFHVCSAK